MLIGYFKEYKGHIGTIEFGINHGGYYGHILDTPEYVSYVGGCSATALYDAFTVAVDVYKNTSQSIKTKIKNERETL